MGVAMGAGKHTHLDARHGTLRASFLRVVYPKAKRIDEGGRMQPNEV
jgi:hypothetical protein